MRSAKDVIQISADFCITITQLSKVCNVFITSKHIIKMFSKSTIVKEKCNNFKPEKKHAFRRLCTIIVVCAMMQRHIESLFF